MVATESMCKLGLEKNENYMSFMTSSTVINLRLVARRTGMVSAAMLVLRSLGYERLLTRAIAARLLPGACIWDVGANVGYYTKLFSERVGSLGRVYAFEPVPATISRLATAAGGLNNVLIRPVALSDHNGYATIDPGHEDRLETARIEEGGAVSIELQTGDNLVSTGAARLPSMIKIDVEGHELEVLRGMRQILRAGILRDIFIEVHFAIFEATGRSDRPALIEKILSSCDFKLRWIDQSHLHAFR
jgi:FkbM family methyltransferase